MPYNAPSPEEVDIQRKLKLAEMLRQQDPMQGQMVSGHYVNASPLTGLANLLRSYASNQMEGEAAGMQKQSNQAYADTLKQAGIAGMGQEQQTAPYQADTFDAEDAQGMTGNQTITQPEIQGDPRKMAQILMGNQRAAPMGFELMLKQAQQEAEAKKAASKPIVVGRSLMKPTGEIIGTDSTWAGEQQAARDAKMTELATRLEDSRNSREEQANLRRELADLQRQTQLAIANQSSQDRRFMANQSSADRMAIASMANAQKQQKNVPKLPTSALKLQQEELDAIGTSKTLKSDMGAIVKQIDSGDLDLGPVDNLLSKARNYTGLSSKNSRNFASFKATLEKMRNDSLRLNKGVQTEGDAVRAWNELFDNLNDDKVVKQRLGELQQINDRAANLRKMNLEVIRSNFGVDPLDTSGYENQPAAVGNQQSGQAPAGKIKRYNPSTGRIE